MYGCTEAFLADMKWILHNCIIYNGGRLLHLYQHPPELQDYWANINIYIYNNYILIDSVQEIIN